MLSYERFGKFICLKYIVADMSIIFEGSPSISGSQRDNKVTGTCSWPLGEETSCVYSTLYARNCQVTSPSSWTKCQVFRYRTSSAKEVYPHDAPGKFFKDIASNLSLIHSKSFSIQEFMNSSW